MAFSSSLSPLLLFFLLLLPSNLSAQPYTNISLNTTFTPLGSPSSWPSPSGDFAFGFRRLEANTSLFLLAVWFDKIPNKTIVWTANGANPVTAESKAELTSDGQLSLKDSTGQEIWNAAVDAAASASMLDTGNFVLSSAAIGTIWQSFDHATDTILPGQVVKRGTSIFAKLTDDDYSPGRFALTLQDDGNICLNPIAYPSSFKYRTYWYSSTNGTEDNLVFNASSGSLYLSFSKNNSLLFTVFTAPADTATGDYYLRATMDPDGVFRQYSFPKSSKLITGRWTGRWTVKNFIGSDICNQTFDTGSGSCGFNSYCVTDAEGKSICQCPPYYSFIDPVRKYEGCKPDFSAQICEPGGETPFNFTLLENVDWPLHDAEQLSPMNETECRGNCLKDCLCLVAIYDSGTDNGTCRKKKLPLSNGRRRSDVNGKAFIKFSTLNYSVPRPPPADSIIRNAHWKTWAVVASSILGGFMVSNIGLIGAFCFVRGRSPRALRPNYGSITGPTLRSFAYEELEEATKGFSEEVGRGAFGTVYKGVLSSQPEIQIAVKKLQLEQNPLEEAEKEFMNEVTTIGQTHHRNLVQLLGFCKEGVHRLMVFEFMSKGSLNKFVFGSDRPDWNQRVQIVLGIAGGLAYLHEECRTQIIHCDIKPQNILLDDNLEARISDFGLAKLLRLDQTRTSTGIRGTIGYFAPEWFKNVAITTKVDVYSFGVMLLEIVCCRRNFDWGLESQKRVTVIDRAKECYKNGRLDLLVPDDEEAKRDGARLERFVMVGISCIQDEPWLRPSMKMAVQMLEGAIAVALSPNMYSIGS